VDKGIIVVTPRKPTEGEQSGGQQGGRVEDRRPERSDDRKLLLSQ
jgi:hypothetical protein